MILILSIFFIFIILFYIDNILYRKNNNEPTEFGRMIRSPFAFIFVLILIVTLFLKDCYIYFQKDSK